MHSPTAARVSAKPAVDPYRVMVVDDSAVVRGIIVRSLEADPAIKVVTTCGNGQMAISALRGLSVDVIILDVEMPIMDGLTALPKLLEIDPDAQIVVASTLTMRNADISLKCLTAGATDYLAKPTTSSEIGAAGGFAGDLVAKVKALGAARRRLGPRKVAAKGATVPVPKPATEARKLNLRPPSGFAPKILAIGSSTGGPQALFSMFSMLQGVTKLPIVITQHMPATFTTILAEHIAKVSKRPCTEGRNGEMLEAGHIYVAPGDFHMCIEGTEARPVIKLNKEPPENFCRPAVDPMFRSLAAIYGPRVLALILTGMGQDGLAGGRVLVEGGATLLAQDESTSVVWGMPGAVAMAGICSAVLPISHIAPYITKLVGGAK